MPDAGERPTLAAALTQLRDRRRLNNAQLARALGASQSLVSRWLRGEVVPGISYISQLAAYFGVDREWLEWLAGYRANSSAAEHATVDPEIAAMLDSDRAETLEMLKDIPPVFYVSIMAAQRDTRKNFVQAIRDAVSQLADTQLARPSKPRPNMKIKGETGPTDELSVRNRFASTISNLLTVPA